jgi:hypothetical protein
MNAKLIGLVAIALIALVGISCANIVSSSDKEFYSPEYTSKYVDTNPTFDLMNPDSYGYVVFRISGTSVQDNTVWYQNAKQGLKFDPTYHADQTEVAGQNPGFAKVKLLTDGSMPAPEILGAGHYIAYLQRGNGAQLETKEFDIGAGQTTYVSFIGDSIPSVVVKNEPAPIPQPDCKNVYHPGYVEWKKVKVCNGHHCDWVWIPECHPGYWEEICKN